MSLFIKFLDWGSGIHLVMAWCLSLPAVAYGIFSLFLFPDQWMISLMLIPIGTYCILHVTYDSLSDYVSYHLEKEKRKRRRK